MLLRRDAIRSQNVLVDGLAVADLEQCHRLLVLKDLTSVGRIDGNE